MNSPIAPPPIALSHAELENATRAIAQATNVPKVENAPVSVTGSAVKTPVRRSKLGSVAALCAFGALTAAAGLVGFAAMRKRRTKVWYRFLSKPKATPPDRVFGLVWPVLYGLSAVSAWRVWRTPDSPARTKALGMWGAQLLTNAAWTPLFFGAKKTHLAMGDLAGLAGSLGGYTFHARKVDPLAAWLTVPYLGWTAFAGYLNGSIVVKNRGPLKRALSRL